MAEQSRSKWIALSVAAAVLLLAVMFVLPRLLVGRVPAPKPPHGTVMDAGISCRVPQTLALIPQPNAEDPALIIATEGSSKVLLDGAPVFSGADAPKHFKVGEHGLRVESSSSPIASNVRLDPWKPALLYVPDDAQVGTLLIRVNAQCTVCRAPIAPQSLDFVKRPDSLNYLLTEAAKQLRAHDWASAGELLRGVPMKERRSDTFVLLSAAFFSEVGQPSDVQTALGQNPQGKRLMARVEELTQSERQRRHEVLLARWNKLTDRYSALVSRYEAQLRASLEERARRLEKLSDALTRAAEKKDVLAEDELVRAAAENLGSLVEAIRATAPNDCAFQANVVATALQ